MRIRYRNFYLFFLTLITIGNFSIFSYAQCNFNKLPEGELCSSATYICGSALDGYSNSLPSKMSVDQTWTGLCNGNGSPQNIIWFSFTPCDSLVTLEITVNACYVFDTITQRSLGTHPNAGLPNAFGQYDQTPQEMQALIREYLQDNLVNIIGGCCGTTPEHIKAIADVAKEFKPRIILENA